jgi:hypothetical protein
VSEDQAGLFDVAELAPLPNARRAEAGLMAALRAAETAHSIGPMDGGLVAAALIAARALDGAEAIASPKDRAYAVTALLPPLQKALHGLRLPAEVTPVQEGPVEVPTGGAAQTSSWLGEHLGPS